MSKTKQRAFIGLVAVVGLAAAAVLAVVGLPYGKGSPEAFAHAYVHPDPPNVAMHLEIDAVKDHNTGAPTDWCDPVDLTATVAVGDTHQVAVCLDDYVANDVLSFQMRLVTTDLLPTGGDLFGDLNFAPDPDVAMPHAPGTGEEVKNGGTGPDCIATGCVDDNPDANTGDSATGLKLGSGWDCTGATVIRPRSEKLPIELVCNADVTAKDLDLSHDMGLLATITFKAIATGADTISFLPWTSIGMNTTTPGSCGDVTDNLMGCFGATINKVADLSIEKTVVTDPVVAGSSVDFQLDATDNVGGGTFVVVFDDLPNNLIYDDVATDAANVGNYCSLVTVWPVPPVGDGVNVVICGDVLNIFGTGGTLPVVTPATLHVIADVPIEKAGKDEVNVAVVGPEDPNMANNVDIVPFHVADAAMTITDESTGVHSVGDTFMWTVTATSTGDSPASSVEITKIVDDNQCIVEDGADLGATPGSCVISIDGLTTPCVAPQGNKAVCTVTDPVDKGASVVATITVEVVDSVGNECTNEAEVCWADPVCASATGTEVCLPPTVRMEKDIDTDASTIDNDVNLFIKKDGAGGFVPLVIYELVSNPGNDPDGVGAYEFQLKFDHKIFDIEIADTSWLSNSDDIPPGPRTVSCDMTIITENDIRWGCVSSGGVPGQLDAGTAAIITVYPEPDLYLRLTPGQENGVFRMLLDENCELADVLGDPLKIVNPDGSESLAPGILPGGLVEVCSDMGITVRILEGDLDLDCVVGLLDEQAIAFRYGAVFGTLYYDPWYDLEPWNKDYDIDIKDLQKVWGRQGSVCDINGVGTIPPQLPLPVPDP